MSGASVGSGPTDDGSASSLLSFTSCESALAAAPPEQERLVTILTLELRRDVEQRPENHRAVIIDKIDNACLRDQSAKLDQLTRSLTSLHHPRARVTASPRRQ